MVLIERNLQAKVMLITSWFVLFLFVLSIGFIFGCGKKRPPVPPPKYRPNAVSDLDYRVDRQKVTLAWTTPATDATKTVVTDGCVVYRARQSLLETDCTSCTVPFVSVANIPAGQSSPDANNQTVLTYTETLLPGFTYTYKVVCFTRGGGPSEDSNVVNFRY
jgi:hypothetical protein